MPSSNVPAAAFNTFTVSASTNTIRLGSRRALLPIAPQYLIIQSKATIKIGGVKIPVGNWILRHAAVHGCLCDRGRYCSEQSWVNGFRYDIIGPTEMVLSL
jgi:hypothetical protein